MTDLQFLLTKNEEAQELSHDAPQEDRDTKPSPGLQQREIH